MSWLKAFRARLRLLFSRGAAESRMEEEIQLHLEMEADRLMREQGLEAGEARRRALVAFGGVEKTREELRDGRGLAWLSGLRLDMKLGARMLLKYPVLTGASVVALAIALALAASWFQFMGNLVRPELPLEDADRIVSIRNQDLAAGAADPRSLHDFETWRAEVESIEDLGAASHIEYNVTTADGLTTTLRGARVTPSVFRFARVDPVLGRVLTDPDDRADADPVAVIGHSAWQRLFGGDPGAVGQTIRLGSEHATIVGVMPEGFGFPVNQEVWTPLRENVVDHERRAGPRLTVVGRLAPGASVEEAQAELDVIGRRTAAEFPATHEHLRPDVRKFGAGNDMTAPAALGNIPFLLFLLVVSANVATLLFARTATRQSELAMRRALGASRRRIVVQLVAEALVLTSLAAVLALAVTHWGMGRGMELFWEVQQAAPPFWFDAGLSVTSVLYVLALATIGAVIIGGLPALRATRDRLRGRIHERGAGGSGMRFGRIATGVIVVQVALCVAFIPVAIMEGRALLPDRSDADFHADAYLSGRVVTQTDPEGDTRAALLDEVRSRLAAEPGVMAATRSNRLLGFNHPMEPIQIDGDSANVIREARQVAVDPDFFDAMGARIVSGRALRQGDVTGEAAVIVVDREWARANFPDANPLGRRLRYPGRSGERGGQWHEIVGVVAGMGAAAGPGSAVAVFHPLRPEEHESVQIFLRTAGDPAPLTPQIQSLVASIDPGLVVADLKPLDEVWRPVERSDLFFATALNVVGAVIVLFALMGIYALMSFTVARRTREIGIRAALGANPRRIIMAIFSRALGQIGLGVVVGGVLISAAIADSPETFGLVGGVAAAMVAVGLLGCIVPATRALRIQPTEALREE